MPITRQSLAARRAAPHALVAAAALAAALAAPLAFAQATPPQAPPAATAASMDIPRVIEHVTSLGYRDVEEVERKGDKLYEIKARNPQGERVEITVDARSGEILRSERDR